MIYAPVFQDSSADEPTPECMDFFGADTFLENGRPTGCAGKMAVR